MMRLTEMQPSEMNLQQRAVWEKIRDPKTYRLKGASSIWIRIPALAEATYDLMEVLNQTTSVRSQDYHLIPMVVSRRYTVSAMWANHARSASQKGVSDEVIEAINQGRMPSFPEEESKITYLMAQALADREAVPDELFHRAKDLLGQDRITEIASIFGAYSMIAILFLCFDRQVPDTGYTLSLDYISPQKRTQEHLTANRMDPLIPEALNEEQRELYERFAKTHDGKFAGPQVPRLRLPKISAPVQRINRILRSESTLQRQIFEMITLLVAKAWNAEYMWKAHVRDGIKAGLTEESLLALKEGRCPEGLSEKERVIIELAQTLLQFTIPSDELYQKAFNLLGETQLVEVASDVGYYGMAASMINAFNIMD